MSEPRSEPTPELRDRLRADLRHRVRPMPGRDPDQRGRSATPLELLYDLTYVIAFGASADELAQHVAEGGVGPALAAYVFAVFAVSWAWMGFTWFASAYGNDDAVLRVATFVQMVGVVVLTFGLPVSFTRAAEGHSPLNPLLVVGYAVMRVPLAVLWMRAAHADPGRRRAALGYATSILVAQVGWVVLAASGLPMAVVVPAIVLLAVAEMVAPPVLEGRLGRAPWNAGHIAERFSLLTLITLGEVVAATTRAVGALTHEQGWTAAAVVIVASGLALSVTLWWAYFLIPSRAVLEQWPDRTFGWRYAHLPIAGGIAAVGAGLHCAALAVEDGSMSLGGVTTALVVPVGAVVLMIFVTWSVLMRSYDLTHVPLMVAALVPLVAALVVGHLLGDGGPLDPESSADAVALAVVFALVALSGVVEVVGHERVGYSHTVRALQC